VRKKRKRKGGEKGEEEGAWGDGGGVIRPNRTSDQVKRTVGKEGGWQAEGKKEKES